MNFSKLEITVSIAPHFIFEITPETIIHKRWDFLQISAQTMLKRLASPKVQNSKVGWPLKWTCFDRVRLFGHAVPVANIWIVTYNKNECTQFFVLNVTIYTSLKIIYFILYSYVGKAPGTWCIQTYKYSKYSIWIYIMNTFFGST